MNLRLNPEEEKLIEQKVESGLYRYPDEVIDAALHLLDERDRKLEALQKDIQAGLTSGPGRPLDESVPRDVKRRGRERLGRERTE